MIREYDISFTRVMDVRIEPMQDMVNVHYTVVVDDRVRYRTSYPLRWEMEKVSGPGIREVSPDDVKRILFDQFDAMKEGRIKLYFMDAPLAK